MYHYSLLRMARSILLLALSALFLNCSSSHDSDSDSNDVQRSESVPSVSAANPANAQVDIPLNAPIVVTFTDEIDPSTVTASSFIVRNGESQVEGTLSAAGNTITFTPNGPLLQKTTYTVLITTSVKDSAGTSLAEDYTLSFTTIEITPLGKWIKIAAGWDNGAAINENGTLWAWGCNYSGQLGNGSGGDQTHAADSNVPIQIGSDTDWADISLGHHSSYALKTDGSMWAWGDGYLGDGTLVLKKSPVRIGENSLWSDVNASLEYFTFAINNDGSLWAWGLNDFGQFGNGTNGDQATSKVPVQTNSDSDWKIISAGKDHAAAIKNDGTLWAWGHNWYGQLGDGTGGSHSAANDSNVPKKIGVDADWQTVAANGNFTLAIKTDGTLWAWGDNQHGQRGDADNSPKNSPVQVGSDSDWSDVSAGFDHAVGIKTDGTLWAWGSNIHGQLGNGTTIDKNAPEKIGADADWSDISAGKDLTIALKNDGSLWAWGYNNFGQVGDGSATDRYSPTRIK